MLGITVIDSITQAQEVRISSFVHACSAFSVWTLYAVLHFRQALLLAPVLFRIKRRVQPSPDFSL